MHKTFVISLLAKWASSQTFSINCIFPASETIFWLRKYSERFTCQWCLYRILWFCFYRRFWLIDSIESKEGETMAATPMTADNDSLPAVDDIVLSSRNKAYKLISVLGEGGYGSVFLARCENDNKLALSCHECRKECSHSSAFSATVCCIHRWSSNKKFSLYPGLEQPVSQWKKFAWSNLEQHAQGANLKYP